MESECYVEEVVCAFGGQRHAAVALSVLIGKPVAEGTVHTWRKQKNIPAWWRFIIRNHADALGLRDKSALRSMP